MKNLVYITAVCLLITCSTPEKIPDGFKEAPPPAQTTTTSLEELKPFLKPDQSEYLLGPGDAIQIISPTWKILSQEYIISPGGTIVVHPGQEVKIAGLTRKQGEDFLKKKLIHFYNPISLTLRVLRYENNSVFIFGHVAKPGVIKFNGRGNLLEAVSLAGIKLENQKNQKVTRCSIVRGRNKIFWIDLNELLQRGNTLLNVDLSSGDVIYVPHPGSSFVYMMGEVAKPGSISWDQNLSVLSALGQAGGLTEDANTSKIKIIRRGPKGSVATLNLDKLRKNADFSRNFQLKPDDIVYVPRRGIAKFNYVLRMLNPFAQLFVIGTSVKSATE